MRYYKRNAVENAVQKLAGVISNNTALSERLGLRGAVSFQSHTNLPTPSALNTAPQDLARLSLDDPDNDAPPLNQRRIKTRRGQGNPADQFYIYKTAEGMHIPTITIKYKAPHKLTKEEVATGLQGEIQPAHDVINQDGEGFPFTAK